LNPRGRLFTHLLAFEASAFNPSAISPANALRSEKVLYQTAAVLCQHPTCVLNAMIQFIHFEDVGYGPHSSGLWVRSAKYQALDSCQDKRTGTHTARFYGHIHGCITEPPGIDSLGGFSNSALFPHEQLDHCQFLCDCGLCR
jgi:hypothetical protein